MYHQEKVLQADIAKLLNNHRDGGLKRKQSPQPNTHSRLAGIIHSAASSFAAWHVRCYKIKLRTQFPLDEFFLRSRMRRHDGCV